MRYNQVCHLRAILIIVIPDGWLDFFAVSSIGAMALPGSVLVMALKRFWGYGDKTADCARGLKLLQDLFSQ